MRALLLLGLFSVVRGGAVQAQCTVGALEVLDHSRTAGIPFASPADPGAQPTRLRALVWSPGGSGEPRSYAELITAVSPGADPAGTLTARLRFYGASVDSAEVARAVQRPSACRGVATVPRAMGGVVLIAGAFPPVMYEGAAVALAQQGITTVAMMGASESAMRLVINQLAARGWSVERLALVGHGQGGPVAQLLAMTNGAVRGIVSLDGFEALNRARHPGLTNDAAWRPGNLRVPVLHWQPDNHPDADTVHHALAARSDLIQVTLTNTPGRQWMTAPELALAPAALRALIGAAGGAAQDAAVTHSVAFLTSVLSDSAFSAAQFRTQLQRALPAEYAIGWRAALPRPALQLDGRLDEPAWRSARTLPDASDTEVRIAEDCDYLYVAIVPQRAAPFITELFLADSTGRRLLLHASASLCWAWETTEVAASDCNKNEAWWGASRTSQPGDAPAGEYLIAKRALGIPRCGTAAGFRIGALTGGWGRSTSYPAASDKARVETWGRMGRD
jgi:dienelactone hydrolase